MQVTKNYGLIKQELTDAADITQISKNWDKVDAELKKLDDEKFDKVGGTISGNVTANKVHLAQGVIGAVNSTGEIKVRGGTTDTDGSSLTLSGKDHTSKGKFSLTAHNGTQSVDLNGTADGQLTWDGNHVVRSINGATANSSGAVTLKNFPQGANVTGETITGSLTVSSGTVTNTLNVTGESTFDGKVTASNIRGADDVVNIGVTNSKQELIGIIAQLLNGVTPRISVTHNPEKSANDKQVATTYWVKNLIATQSEYGLVKLASEEDLLNEAPQNAICTELIYDINEFRRKSTAYKVGEKVDCAFQYERFLECTKAGTTSANLLDTRNVTHGQKIVDGTVEWTVRTHARSVNNAVADANGNVSIPSYTHPNSGVQAGTYNTVTVDAQGHVTAGENKPSGLGEADVKRIVLDTFFPVGSTYISADANFNPNTQFGGTWSKIENRFLLGSGSRGVGAQGGEETHTLSLDEMPSHNHGVGSIQSTGEFGYQRADVQTYSYASGSFKVVSGGQGYTGQHRVAGNKYQHFMSNSRSGSTASNGSSKAHNNMPPYEVVNIWKRTS